MAGLKRAMLFVSVARFIVPPAELLQTGYTFARLRFHGVARVGGSRLDLRRLRARHAESEVGISGTAAHDRMLVGTIRRDAG